MRGYGKSEKSWTCLFRNSRRSPLTTKSMYKNGYVKFTPFRTLLSKLIALGCKRCATVHFHPCRSRIVSSGRRLDCWFSCRGDQPEPCPPKEPATDQPAFLRLRAQFRQHFCPR